MQLPVEGGSGKGLQNLWNMTTQGTTYQSFAPQVQNYYKPNVTQPNAKSGSSKTLSTSNRANVSWGFTPDPKYYGTSNSWDSEPTVDNGRSAYVRNQRDQQQQIFDGGQYPAFSIPGMGSSGYSETSYGVGDAGSKYKTELDALIKKGFSYKPEDDPLYKALQETAQKQAKVASGEAMETMNDRGILNSTITSDRLGQIEQTAQDQVTKAVPELENNAYNKYMNQVNQLYQMYNSERQFALEQAKFKFTQHQTAIENAMKQQGMSMDALQYQINTLLSYQKQNGSGGISAQATQNALSEMMQMKSADQAFAYFQKNSYTYANSGVDLMKVLDGMDKVWPGFRDSALGGGTSTSGNYNFHK